MGKEGTSGGGLGEGGSKGRQGGSDDARQAESIIGGREG